MFDLSENTRKRYLEVQKEMTDEVKNNIVKLLPEFNEHYYSKRKFWDYKVFIIIKYYPDEYSFFKCGYMNPRIKIKSPDGKYITTVNVEHFEFIV
jgi:hypothetical protein